MAKGFNLTAEINLRGPSNVRQVVSSIRKQLTGINADVSVKISPQTAKNINTANKSFQNFNKTLKQTQSLAAATASSFSQLSNAAAQLSGNLKGVPATIQQAAKATQQLSQTNTQAVGTVRQLSSEFAEFGKQSALAVRRFAAFATVTGAIYKVSNAINQASQDFINFERELVRVAQVSGSSIQNLDFLVQNVTRLSTTLGVASEDLIGVSRTLTQAGLSARDTSAALEALAKSALAPTFDNLNRTVEGSVALMKQFGISANQLEGALGSINAVAGQFAVEAGDIITAISRTGGVFASASQGVSQGTDALNEFIAVFTSIRATTRESAETIATGLRTIFTRIQRTDTIDALKAYGVTLTDLEGKFVGPYRAVQLLAEGLGQLDPRDLKFSQIVEELGGFRQIGKVIPLIQQFATAQDALTAAQQGQGSLARDAATAQQSLAVQITRVQEEFTALIRSIGQSEGFQTFIRLGLDLASAFIQVADAAKAALPAIAALFAVKGLKALGQFGSGFLGGLKKNQGLNDGGYVHHFARGGVVPGSGSRDTVPAMLQPGEFVIRKKAVAQLGTQRLHKMNKFAIGGKVNDFAVSAAYTQTPEAQPTWDKAKGGPFVTTGETPNKFNPEDQFTYKKETKKVNVNRLSAPRSAGAREKYNTVRDKDPRARGFAFEEVLRDAGIVSSLAKRANNAQGSARLDAKDSNGVAEIKSTQEIIDDANINAKMIGAALNPIGDTDQVIRERFIKNAELNKGPNTFDLGTVTVYQDVTPVIGSDGKRTRLGRDNKNNKNLGGYIQSFAKGGDVVPAMLTPGEFVINKQAASTIGSARLNKLNKADRIKGYNKGGWVGFATGGGVEARGTELGTIGINPQNVAGLQELVKTISELGVIGSSTAKLLESGNQASYQSAIEALEADKLRAIAIGQSTAAIDENIAALKAQGDKAEKVAKALKGASGEQLQAVQTRFAQDEAYFRDPTTTEAQVRDMAELDVDMSLGGGSELGKLVAAGEVDIKSIQDYIAQASRERQTLLEMDKRYTSDRAAELRGQGKTAEEIDKIIKKELDIRRKSVDQFARTQGAKGPGDFGRRISDFSNKIGIGVSLFTSTISSILGEATTEAQASMNAAIQSGGATFGAAQIASGAAIDLLPDQFKGLGGVIGLVASGALAAGQALISAANAAREFRINEQFKKAETASEQVAEAFGKLEKDVDSIDVQTAIEDKLIQAGDALSRGLAIQQNEAKLFWLNAIDVISSGGGRTGQEAAQRSQILERDGIVSYIRSFDDSFRESRMAATRPERSQASAAQFRPVADNINRLLEQRLGKGESVSDIFNDIDFDSFANSLARADQATNQRIQAILDDTSLSQAEKDARIKHISTIYAEEQVRQKAAVIARQKEIDALQASTTRYTKSLERMYTNMEQSINAAVASLNRMNSQIDTTIASLQGQAKIGDVILDAITVLQNPRAFGSAQVQSATSSAAGIFGSEASNIAGLINLGENIEASVFGSISRTLEQAAAAGESPSNARVLQDIDTGIQNTLNNLGLPPELADKLAKEVRVAFKDITKDQEGDFDFAEISEKIAGLGSVIESSARAREVAIKALEAYNTALNSYTQNLNKVIDIEISSRNYARKSLDILANSALDLSRALGESVSVNDIINKRNREIGRQTGGPTSPQDVFDQIQKLERDRVSQQATVDATAQTGLGGTDQFVEFNNKLKDTSIGLRENIAALKSMADNTEVASAALNKIQEAQQRTAGQVGFLEKAVTSTPEELESMNRAFGRLQNNMNGQINTINNSVGAQKAYYEALQNGANQFQAMRAAQGAFAQERGESLSLLKDILPFLGDSEESGGIRANVLESMLRESGIGINPLIQQVLNSLRNPQADPAVAAAIQQYRQANSLQAEANKLLGRLDAQLASDISAQNEQAFRNALTNTVLNFENSQLNDINLGIGQVVQNTAQTAQNTTPQNNQQNNQPNNPPPAPAPAFARGGVIYAQTGQEIFQPKGTDTVPAMLTPGEFVVNRKATQANLPLLKSINSGYYAAGGLVTSWHSNAIGQSQRSTKKSYLDEDLLDSTEIDVRYPVPSLLTVVNDNDNRLYPLNDNQNADLSKLQTSGKLTYGFMPTINRRDVDIGISSPEISSSYVYGAADKESYGGLRGYGLFKSSGNRGSIKEEDLDSYRDKLNKFKTNSNNLASDRLIKDIYNNTYKDIPKNATATTSYTQYNPNITPTEAFLGLSKNSSALDDTGLAVSASMNGYKIWATKTRDWFNRLTDFEAWTTISQAPPAFGSDDRRQEGVALGAPGDITYLQKSLPSANDESFSTGDKLKTLIDNHTLAYKAYEASLELLDPNFQPDFRDVAKSKTFRKLANLYSGISPFESFDDGRIFSEYSNIVQNTNGNLLTVVSDASLQNLIKKRGEVAAQQSAAGDSVKGFFGAAGLLKTDVTTGKLFDIKKPPDAKKEFAWVAGINPSELGQEFEEAKKEAINKAASDDDIVKMELLSPEQIKFPVQVAGQNFDFDTQAWYDKYTGQLYDPNTGEYDGKSFTKFLPKGSNDPFALFQNVKRDQAEWLAFDNKLPNNVAPVAVNQAVQKRIDDYYNSINQQNPDGNNALKQALAQTTANMNPSLIKYSASSDQLPRFISELAVGQDVRIGDMLVENIKKNAKSVGAAGEKIATPAGPAFTEKGEQLDDSLFAEVTKKLTLGGLQLFNGRAFSNSRQFLDRNLGRIHRNNDIDTKEEAQQAAGFVSNIFQVVGGEASRLFNFARNPRYAQFLKENFILSSGASQAFSGINQGATALINDFFKYAGGDFPLGAVEGLFRTLGGGQALEQAKNKPLPGGYADIFNNQLQGTKIAEIGPNGSIIYKPMTDAVPEDARGLIDLIFNPYNAFPNTLARTNLINKFQTDLNNLKGGGGLPYFDANTYGFINRGIDILEQWYGGAQGWSGQDFIFDKQANPDDNARAQQLATQFANIGQLYQEAQAVNAAFGIKNKYGNLPDNRWFLARARAGADPQTLATGGIVYASTGGQMVNFQPQGTDTVPAMLTPGEFVVNRQATQANLPLLKAINDGQSYSTGGVVYAATGKLIAPGVRSTFVSADGSKEMEAQLISFDGETVKLLRLLDNKEFSVSINKFDKPTIEALNIGRGANSLGGSGVMVPPELMSMGTRKWTWTDPDTRETITRKAKVVSIDSFGFGGLNDVQLQMLDGPNQGNTISVPGQALSNESREAVINIFSETSESGGVPVQELGSDGPQFGPITTDETRYFDGDQNLDMDDRIVLRNERQADRLKRQQLIGDKPVQAEKLYDRRKVRQEAALEEYKRYDDDPERINRLKKAGLTDERIAELKSSAFARAGLRTETEETNDRIDTMRRNGMSEAAINKFENDRQVRLTEQKYVADKVDSGEDKDEAIKEFRQERTFRKAGLQQAIEQQAMDDLDISDDESVMKAFTVTGRDKGLEPGSNAWNQAYDKFKSEQIQQARKERIETEKAQRPDPAQQAADKKAREERIAAESQRRRDIEKYGLDAVNKRDQEREDRRLAAEEKGRQNREAREARMKASEEKFKEEMDASNKKYEERRSAIRQQTAERQATIQNEPPAESYKERIARQRRELEIDDESFAKRRYTRYYSEDGKTRYPNGVTITAKDAAEAQKLQEEANEQRDKLDFVRAEREKIQARRKAEEDRKNYGAYVNMEKSGNTFLQEAYQDLDELTGGAFGGFANSSLVRAGAETLETGTEIGKGLFKKGAGLAAETGGTALDLLNTASKSTIGVDIEKGLGVDARALENKGRNLGDSGGFQLQSASERVTSNVLALTESAANLIPGVSIDSGVEDARNIADETSALSQRQEQKYLKGATESVKNVYGYSKEGAGIVGDPLNIAGLAGAKKVGSRLIKETTEQVADPATVARLARIKDIRKRAAKVGTSVDAELTIANAQRPTLSNAVTDIQEGLLASADETLDILEQRIAPLEQSRSSISGQYPARSTLPESPNPSRMQKGLSNPTPPKTPSQRRIEALKDEHDWRRSESLFKPTDSPYAGDGRISDYMPTGSTGPTMSKEEAISTARNLRAQIDDASTKIAEPTKTASKRPQAKQKKVPLFARNRTQARANAEASNRMIGGMSQSGREVAERKITSGVTREGGQRNAFMQKQTQAAIDAQAASVGPTTRAAVETPAVPAGVASSRTRQASKTTTNPLDDPESIWYQDRTGYFDDPESIFYRDSSVDLPPNNAAAVNAETASMRPITQAQNTIPSSDSPAVRVDVGNPRTQATQQGIQVQAKTPQQLQARADEIRALRQKGMSNLTEIEYDRLQQAMQDPELLPYLHLRQGGMVYASKGMMIPYQPKGTDTVPAMLTPGEFVVNRAATQANLPLLKAINNGAQGYNAGGIAYRSKGGPVQYLEGGGMAEDTSIAFAGSLQSATQELTKFGNILKQLTDAFNGKDTANQGGSSNGVNISGVEEFTNKIQTLINNLNGLSQIPTQITLEGRHEVNVNIVGGEALQSLESGLQEFTANLVNNAIAKYDADKFEGGGGGGW